MVNVYTYYDNDKNVIARIIPRDDHTISEKTYNKLLKKRTVGGLAGIYTDAEFDVDVVDDDGYKTAYIHGMGCKK